MPSESELVALAVVAASTEGILTVAPGGVIFSANPAADRLFASEPGGLVGLDVSALVPSEHAGSHRSRVMHFDRQGSHVVGLDRYVGARRVDGSVFPAEITLTQLDVLGIDLVCAVVRDVTERVEMHERLVYQSLHDPLTGLGNRALLSDRIGHALARLERRPGLLGVLVCDVDRFKAINDTYGHLVGDVVLVELAARMRSVVRPEDTVVRHGGDEFVVLCEAVPTQVDAQQLAQRLVEVVRAPVLVNGAEIRSTLSVGGYVCSSCETEDQLLHLADEALYQAKREGRDRAVVLPQSRPAAFSAR